MLWQLTDADLERLDRCEGHPIAYRRKRLLVWTGEARRRRAHVYVKERGETSEPSRDYVHVIWRAYQEFGFDPLDLASAVALSREET